MDRISDSFPRSAYSTSRCRSTIRSFVDLGKGMVSVSCVSGETCALPVYTTGPVWLAVPRVPSGISLCHENISIQCGSRLHCLSTR